MRMRHATTAPDPAAASAIKVAESPAAIDRAEWNALVSASPAPSPFLRHEFLAALDATGCASARAGWRPRFLTLRRAGRLAAAMPLYAKSHSWGEFVFDWAWADAYRRHGLAYYPKLVAAVPFTPVAGTRLLAANDDDRRALLRAAVAMSADYSSLHVLFPTREEAALAENEGLMLRRGVQFHWTNDGYASFDDFLATLSHDKRKKIRQERRKVGEAGVTLRRLVGDEITAADWRFFYRCHERTYHARGSEPYLSLEFFERIGAALPEHMLLVLAERDGKPIAVALDLFTPDALYGRYWGAVEHVPGLHFEACYYQGIEFAIERGVRVFEGGAQGEHKLARGFLPVETLSAHRLTHPEFAQAVQRFLDRESSGVERYIDELNEHAPFRRDPA